MKRRPSLLFLAGYFPPVNSSACVRTWNIARHLSSLGWRVTVATPGPACWRDPGDVEELERELDRSGVDRIYTGFNWRCLWPGLLDTPNHGLHRYIGGAARRAAAAARVDPWIGWASPTLRACSRLSADDVDVILASGAPFLSFRLARYLSRRLGRPFLVDYRDLWNGNPHERGPVPRSRLREESAALESCSAVVAVTPSIASWLKTRYRVGPKIDVITNGFDPDEMQAVQPLRFDHFAIVYAGAFHEPKRVATPLMATLAKLDADPCRRCNGWRLHYYGRDTEHILQEARRANLEHRLAIHGPVSRSAALSAMKGADLAVVITHVGENGTVEENGIVTGKLFDCLGLGRPTLVIAPRGSDVHPIVRQAGLARVFAATELDEMRNFVGEVMSRRTPEAKDVAAFEWPQLSRRMDQLLRCHLVGSAPISH